MALEPRMISFLHVDMKKNDLRELLTREKERRVKKESKEKKKKVNSHQTQHKNAQALPH